MDEVIIGSIEVSMVYGEVESLYRLYDERVSGVGS